MRQVLLALVTLMGVTAFAPAPLPRRERGLTSGITIKDIQGTWRVVGIEEKQAGGEFRRGDR